MLCEGVFIGTKPRRLFLCVLPDREAIAAIERRWQNERQRRSIATLKCDSATPLGRG
jgi:hypothetical protein